MEPKEIDIGYLCLQVKLNTLLTDRLITGQPRLSEPAEETFQVKPSICISLLGLSWIVIFQALVGCDDILILGKSPVKWRQHPNMTLAVDWDVKHQSRQEVAKVVGDFSILPCCGFT